MTSITNFIGLTKFFPQTIHHLLQNANISFIKLYIAIFTTIVCSILVNTLSRTSLGCDAFNLDTDVPIIKTGVVNSYFGFSVAQHQINFGRFREKVMLVGAPLTVVPGVRTTSPGALYKCPMTGRMDDCERIRVDDDLAPDKEEKRDNQWLGVTVKSHKEGDAVVTCGHRYARNGSDYHWGFGICYALSTNLKYEEMYSPCIGRPVFKAHQQFGFCQAGTSVHIAANDDLIIGAPGSYTWTGALFKNNVASGIYGDKRWFFTPLEPPDPVPVSHYSFLGMSVYSGIFSAPMDETRPSPKFSGSSVSPPYTFVAGAPRANGTGRVILFERYDKNANAIDGNNNNNNINTGYSMRQNSIPSSHTTLIPTLTLSGKDTIGSGFGYELTGLDFNGDGYLDLAIGAPFHYDVDHESIGGAVYIFINGPQGLNAKQPIVLHGTNDSMFGYSLTSLGDINLDGYDDLAVGAPNSDNGQGAVYIFNGANENEYKHYTLSESTAETKFQQNAGNPFTSDDNQRNTYNSNGDEIIFNNEDVRSDNSDTEGDSDSFVGSNVLSYPASQIITPNVLKYTDTPQNQFDLMYKFEEIIGFGHSLSGGLDMDGNGYPDLLIGSYRSDKIFLLRSRPIINVYSEVRDLPQALDPLNPSEFPCPNDQNFGQSHNTLKPRICFPIKICFRFASVGKSLQQHPAGLKIRYHLIAERFISHHTALVNEPSHTTLHLGNRVGQGITSGFSRVNFFPNPLNNVSYFPSVDKDNYNYDDDENTDHNELIGLKEDSNHRISRVIQLTSSQATQHYICDTSIAYLKPETKDFLRPINFQLLVNLTDKIPNQYVDDPLVDINSYPVLNQDSAIKTFQVQFLKDCGEDDMCESDLSLESKIKLPRSAEMDDQERILLTLGQYKEISFSVSIENYGEAAYETELYIHFSSFINYVGFKVPTSATPKIKANQPGMRIGPKNYLCTLLNATLIKCDIGNPFKRDEKAELIFTFDVSKLKLEDNRINFNVNVTTTSADKGTYVKNRTITALIIIKSEMSLEGISVPEQIFYGGLVQGESEMRRETDIGNPIEHRYVILNHGPGTIASSSVEILWPYEVENRRDQGKWLFYLTRYPWIDGEGMCDVDLKHVNTLKLKLENKHKKISELRPKKNRKKLKSLTKSIKRFKRFSKRVMSRYKRELIILPEARMIGGKMRRIVTMDCSIGTAKCHTIKCQLGQLLPGQSVVIHIKGRLWNSTLVEDYPTIDAVSIVSRAQLSIDKKYNVDQNISNDNSFVYTIAYPDLDVIMEHKITEPWIIIVAICSGIILFFLLTILLWKIGFFKRKVMKPPYSARLEKAKYEDMNEL